MRKEKRNLAITEIFMILIAVIWFIPIYYLIVTTLKSSQEATANPLGLPKVLRLDNYVNAWVNMESQERLEIHYLLRQQQFF